MLLCALLALPSMDDLSVQQLSGPSIFLCEAVALCQGGERVSVTAVILEHFFGVQEKSDRTNEMKDRKCRGFYC